MSMDKPSVQEKFLSEKPLRTRFGMAEQTFIAAVRSAIMAEKAFEGYKPVRLGSEHLVLVLEDPAQRNMVLKLNLGLTISALTDLISSQPQSSAEELQTACRVRLEEERAYIEQLWKALPHELPEARILTRRSLIVDVPVSEALWKGASKHYEFITGITPAAVQAIPKQVPMLLTQQRQFQAQEKRDFWIGEEWRKVPLHAADITKLRRAFFEGVGLDRSADLQGAWQKIFPHLDELVTFAKQDPERLAAFQQAVVGMDRYTQRTRVPLDVLGGDNLFFAQSQANDPWSLVAVDPFFPRYHVAYDRTDLTFLERAIRVSGESVAESAQSSFTPLERRVANMLWHQVIAMKGLAWAAGVPSQLQVKGMDKDNFLNAI